MKKQTYTLFGILVCVLICLSAKAYASKEKLDEKLSICADVIYDFVTIPEEEQSIPTELLKNTQAIAIFPSVMKAGFIIGGSFGHGVIVCRDPRTGAFGAPCFFAIGGGSVGFQLGAQSTDLILLITKASGIDGLLSSNFTLGADASVAAGPVGRTSSASTDITVQTAILSYSRSTGLFAGVSLQGAIISADNKSIKEFYGQPFSPEEIMLEGRVAIPDSARKLINILTQYCGTEAPAASGAPMGVPVDQRQQMGITEQTVVQ